MIEVRISISSPTPVDFRVEYFDANESALKLISNQIIPVGIRQEIAKAEAKVNEDIKPIRNQKYFGSFTYEILGELRSCNSQTARYVEIFSSIAMLAPEQLEQIASKMKGSIRNHLARSQATIYPENPRLACNAREICQGWFLGTNISGREMRKFVVIACRVIGFEFGKDIKLLS
jgi:hypothetical protein